MHEYTVPYQYSSFQATLMRTILLTCEHVTVPTCAEREGRMREREKNNKILISAHISCRNGHGNILWRPQATSDVTRTASSTRKSLPWHIIACPRVCIGLYKRVRMRIHAHAHTRRPRNGQTRHLVTSYCSSHLTHRSHPRPGWWWWWWWWW